MTQAKRIPLKKEAHLIRRFELRINDAALHKIDEWRRKQIFIPSMGEAVRRLIEIGLEEDK